MAGLFNLYINLLASNRNDSCKFLTLPLIAFLTYMLFLPYILPLRFCLTLMCLGIWTISNAYSDSHLLYHNRIYMKFRLLLHRNKSTSNLTKNMSKYRLNPDVQPTSYDLYLHPKLNDGTFAGRVNIALDILKETNALAIHSNKLRILSVTIDNVKGNFEIDKEHELLTIYKNDKSGIEQGTRIVSVEYEGNMKNKIVGLYSSTYTNGKGVKR